MQANFIESSPLPVKAVLAMMGKIQEIYRLPLLPMRRDTRSKLQKIATDVGLLARPAAPAAPVEFYVYESWAAGPHKVIVHRASCGQCSSGKGGPPATIRLIPAGMGPILMSRKLARRRTRYRGF